MFQKAIKTALVKMNTYFSFQKKEKVTLTEYHSTENIAAPNVNTDEAKTVKIIREDLEKSFKLYEKN